MSQSRRIGTAAEDVAARYLLENGYTLVARRAKLSHGELDIVALHGDTLVFVEVKARHNSYETAEESLSPRKLNHLLQAAEEYLAINDLAESETRFDLIVVNEDELRHEPGFITF